MGNIAILLMAAGNSSRMNGIKQLLPWKKSTLLLHAIETIQEVQKEDCYVVLGANYSTILKECNIDALPVTLIRNTHWEKGLGNSIACGVAHILQQNNEYEGVLVCLADQPLINSNYYKQLISVFKLKKHAMVATQYSKNAGVPAIFDKLRSQELLSLDADNGAKQLVMRYTSNINTLDAGNKIKDVDTPEEYKKLYQKYNKTTT